MALADGLEDATVMHNAIDHGSRRHRVGQYSRPMFERYVGR